MTSITSWSSTTYYSPQAKPDKREKPDFSTLDQDGSGGLDESELAAMLAKGPKSASGTSGTNGASSSASSSAVSDLFSKLDADGDGSISESELNEGMKPPERAAEENGWAGMQMDTQSFTMMMQGPPPPPPPSLSELDSDDDGTVTAEEFGVSSTSSDEDDDLFNAIDTDDSGDLSADEVSEFEQKMKTLFSHVQQMGNAEYQSVANATYQTNDANLNLSA